MGVTRFSRSVERRTVAASPTSLLDGGAHALEVVARLDGHVDAADGPIEAEHLLQGEDVHHGQRPAVGGGEIPEQEATNGHGMRAVRRAQRELLALFDSEATGKALRQNDGVAQCHEPHVVPDAEPSFRHPVVAHLAVVEQVETDDP